MILLILYGYILKITGFISLIAVLFKSNFVSFFVGGLLMTGRVFVL